jgi:hypothetical protein
VVWLFRLFITVQDKRSFFFNSDGRLECWPFGPSHPGNDEEWNYSQHVWGARELLTPRSLLIHRSWFMGAWKYNSHVISFWCMLLQRRDLGARPCGVGRLGTSDWQWYLAWFGFYVFFVQIAWNERLWCLVWEWKVGMKINSHSFGSSFHGLLARDCTDVENWKSNTLVERGAATMVRQLRGYLTTVLWNIVTQDTALWKIRATENGSKIWKFEWYKGNWKHSRLLSKTVKLKTL